MKISSKRERTSVPEAAYIGVRQNIKYYPISRRFRIEKKNK